MTDRQIKHLFAVAAREPLTGVIFPWRGRNPRGRSS